jgi:hypothetical protein
MTPEESERMNSLCSRIQEEKDLDKFAALLRELNSLVERKEHRLEQRDKSGAGIPITSHESRKHDWQKRRPWRTIPGIVQKVIKPAFPKEAEKVEISVSAADELFRELRIENTLTDIDGEPVALKHGAQVDITFEAETEDTVKKITRPGI